MQNIIIREAEYIFFTGVMAVMVLSCNGKTNKSSTTGVDTLSKGTYGYDAAYLKKYEAGIIELKDENEDAKLLISPKYQGRVMTSTANGDEGTSFGWLNYEVIAQKNFRTQFNAAGGEERFWLGPEGGQYSLFFKRNDAFIVSNWQVPYIIDTVPFEVVSADKTKAVFNQSATFSNYSGTRFSVGITRTIRLVKKKELGERLNINLPKSLKAVAYESSNRLTNNGNEEWTKEKGLLSIWLLGMMTPSAKTVAFIPFRGSDSAKRFITDDYFGKVPVMRLKIKDSVLYFLCDGKKRSKIGLSPVIAKHMAGSYDFERDVLTLILFSVDKDSLYVNSKWELQDDPYKGDVVNAYNDGPLDNGEQLGFFYELESSSSVHELQAGETQECTQLTCHLQGDYDKLRKLVKEMVQVDLDSLRTMLGKPGK